jgi:amidohydrolase
MMNLKELIQAKTQALLPTWIQFRRHLHQNPELSFQEFKTSEWVQSILTAHNAVLSKSKNDF